MIITDTEQQVTFKEFLNNLKSTLHNAFHEIDDIELFSQKRGFPALVLRNIMETNPLSVAIPTQYGGRGAKVSECLAVLEAASYESLSLSLTFGINIGLFLEPVAKYAQDIVKGDIFKRFLTKQNMGGLMITEPDYGSDALNMQTSNIKQGNTYHIKGTKHWQGLTGMADYWIMTTRSKNEAGELGRDLDFFISDNQQSEQRVIVDEYYNNIGLYAIPYGINNIDIKVPEQFKLQPESTGLKLMMDLLHRSRMQFPGMAMGFIRRMLDESIKHCNSRIVGGKPLLALDQVKQQIAKIQSHFTVCSAMCSRSSDVSGIDNNLALFGVEANTMKAYVSDAMQESAQLQTQLKGANGYKMENIGSRGIVDSRPFQIFEGSNEMLYTQISEMVIKFMGRKKIVNMASFIKVYEITDKAADYFKSLLDFNIDATLPQRKMVDLGKIISKVISANHVFLLGAKGFRPDLISSSLEMLKHEVTMLVSSFNFDSKATPIEDYSDGGSWLAFS
ncbi:MAG: acyl-CoA/acyl-ACP dehydrogenase [Salinivirgaceae bacterium]|jgi:alkylation response protein AidB-like acyl-CoA dehydrogenase|nr:acyl-CoA/acyl-ACP dehydrogenase [Salinivirgaceae bacterium]